MADESNVPHIDYRRVLATYMEFHVGGRDDKKRLQTLMEETGYTVISSCMVPNEPNPYVCITVAGGIDTTRLKRRIEED